MQTPKTRNCCSSETSQKISPSGRKSYEIAQKSSPNSTKSSEIVQKLSPRVVCKLKIPSKDSDSSTHTVRTTSIDRSSKLGGDRKLSISPVAEKKRSNRVADLESQVSELQNDLKKVKEQLDSSEEQRNKALQDAEESNKQLLAMSSKFEETTHKALKLEEEAGGGDQKQQALNQADSEGTAVIDDHVSLFQPEIDKSVDSAFLLDSAMNEIKELKLQLEVVTESETVQTKQADVAKCELNTLKERLADTRFLVEDMKNQLGDSMESESRAKELVSKTLFELQTAKMAVVELKSDGIKTVEAYNDIASELEQSRARVNSLDALVSELKAQTDNESQPKSSSNNEVMSLKSEVNLLKSALEATEIKYRENNTQVEIQLKSTYDMVEQSKSSFRLREAELESEIKQSRLQIEELKANLMDKETELQGIWEENEGLNVKLASKGESDYVDNLKANLIDKETEIQNILEENETLKLTISSNKGKADAEIMYEIEAAKAAEREAIMKLGYVTEEMEKSNRRIAIVSEQIETAQTANNEMEAELRRVKIQSDQWRKAAEAAAAMLSSGNNNGMFMDRTVSMDSRYSPRSRGNVSPYYEEGDDDLIRKKNPNVLKRLGFQWKKKPQK